MRLTEMKRTILSALASLFMLVLLFATAGCSKEEPAVRNSTRDSGDAKAVESQVAAIENNPNMPPQAREAALRSIRAQQAASKQVAEKRGDAPTR
jgi:hypothetical protein